MRLVVADLECFYDPKNLRGDKKPDGSPDPYTIKAMTTESYVRDRRWSIHGCAFKWSANTLPVWYDARELDYIMRNEDWSDVFMVNHHAQFDQLAFSHHYDTVPAMAGCTLSMARLMLGNHISVSLDSVREQFGLPPKITPYNLFEGKYWKDMTPAVQQQVAAGAIDEVESIWKLFGLLMKQGFPVEELDVIDSTVKMFTQPELIGDSTVFAKVWEHEAVRKQAMFDKLGVTAKELGSDDVFASLLRARGIEPETKVTDKGNTKFAFAKTDPFMEEIQQDEDDEVRALAEARLGTKSTLLQTRSETLGWMASRGPLCVYLRYAGAHTSRWSGGDDTNFQNWTNGSEINTAIVAPDGYLIGEPDCSQIECRLLNFCAGQEDKVEEFRSGADPYVGVASAFYGFPVNKKDHPLERQLGKIVELQAGYQSGGNKIRSTVRVKSFGKIILTPAQGVEARDAYRNTHLAVSNPTNGYWKQGEWCIQRMANFESYDWGPLRVRCDKTAGKRRIVLPNGIELKYDTLEYFSDPDDGDRYWRLKTRKGWVKIYGGKLVENCLSGSARVLTRRGWQRIIDVKKEDLLWDGIRWVAHSGVVERGYQQTIVLNGVRMTADHKVLTKHGWVRAASAEGLHRATVHVPHGYSRRWFYRKKAIMALPLRLWTRDHYHRSRFQQAPAPELRMQEKRTDRKVANSAWTEQTSAACCMGFHDSTLYAPKSQGLSQLRRPWNYGMQALDEIRKFLGRYVTNVSDRTYPRTQKQQPRLYFEKLYLGGLLSSGTEPTIEPVNRNALGYNDRSRSQSPGRFRLGHTELSNTSWVAEKRLVQKTGFQEPTFDILNCGPRNRFVVLGDDGPFIVHNCIQALARVVVSQAMIRLKRLGYRCKNTKHDSLWLLIPKDDRLEEHKRVILAEMSRELPWLPGCPLAAEFKGEPAGRITW